MIEERFAESTPFIEHPLSERKCVLTPRQKGTRNTWIVDNRTGNWIALSDDDLIALRSILETKANDQ